MYLLSYIYEIIHIIGVFFVDFKLRITLVCNSESATEAFPWTGKILRKSQLINEENLCVRKKANGFATYKRWGLIENFLLF